MRLSFDSIEEVKTFVKGLKTSRTGKGGDEEEGAQAGGNAPTPIMPPTTNGAAPGPFTQTAGFVPPAGGAGPGAFAAPAVAPEIQGLVNRINAAIDKAVAAGQPADQALSWFKTRCGPEAANATMDQIKNNFLAKCALPNLEEIAKLMNA